MTYYRRLPIFHQLTSNVSDLVENKWKNVNSPTYYNITQYDNDNEIHLFKPNFIYTIDNKYCL